MDDARKRSRKLHWGLLSTRINRALIAPLRSSRRNRLVAVASRSLEKAQTYAKEWGIPKAFGSYEAMLESDDTDVIYNPLPNHLHAEWTIKALQSGKHVLCEKPLALSTNEVDAMAEAANRAGTFLAEAFMYRHHPGYLKLFSVGAELKERFGKDFVKLPAGAIGMDSYIHRLKQGLQQLMAGARKFALKYIDRNDLMALTREAADVSGITYVMEADAKEVDNILG